MFGVIIRNRGASATLTCRVLVLVSLLLPGRVLADGSAVGAFVPANSDVDSDEAVAMTLAIAGALAAETGLPAVSYGDLVGGLGYQGPDAPGSCLDDPICLARVRDRFHMEILIVGRLSRTADGRIRIEMIRTDANPLLRYTRVREVPDDPIEQAEHVKAMVRELVRPPAPSLVVEGAMQVQVEVDGTSVGTGPGRFVVPPGHHVVVLRRGETILSTVGADCGLGGRCMVAIPEAKPVTPEPVVSQPPDTIAKPVAPHRVRWIRPVVYSAIAAGVALLGVGIYEGIKTQDVRDKLHSACPRGSGRCTITERRARSLISSGDGHARRATVFFITGGLASAAGITLAIFDAVRQHSTDEHASLLPDLGVDPASGRAWIGKRISF